ncbi:MAG: hypothetical protein JWN60_1034 [Acidobacteria bacterium]|jgi:uncharacterized protein YecE (DUF72 family)|nr:hypothetical protein [Acidobacteriota bacterium]
MSSDKQSDKNKNNGSELENRGIQIGCQGWNYADWVTKAGDETVFYPRGTKPNEMLALYAEIFDTIEVDSTFYAIPPVSTVENWYKKTPGHFTFSLKMPQEITHEHLLRESSFPVVTEFCERILTLKEKLAAVLIQLPPHFEASKENALALKNFLTWLPQDIRFAVEFRQRDWMVEWTYEELKKNNVALCLVEGNWISREKMFEAIEKTENEFSYIRFMGERDLVRFDKVYRQGDVNLQIWKGEIENIKAKDIYIYFSNYYEGHAPESVNKLKTLFGHTTIDVEKLENQGSLF